MNCAACGTDIPLDASFCPKCGAKATEAKTSHPTFPSGAPADSLRSTADNGDSEQRLWTGGYSGKAMVGSWLVAAVVSVALLIASFFFPPGLLVFLALILLIWVGLALTLAYRKLNIHYELTTQRLVHRTGILTRRSDRIELIDIDDVTFEQGLVERMFGVGKIKITSSDRTHPELVLVGIDEVARVADMIDDARRKERRKRGVHIENI